MEIKLSPDMTIKEREAIVKPLIEKRQQLVILSITGAHPEEMCPILLGTTGYFHSITNSYLMFECISGEYKDKLYMMTFGYSYTFGIVHSADDLDSIQEEISVHRGTDLENASDKLNPSNYFTGLIVTMPDASTKTKLKVTKNKPEPRHTSEITQYLNRDIPDTSLKTIEKHERLIQILEMISDLERRKRNCKENFNSVNGILIELAKRYKDRYHILNKAIQRVWAYYYKELTKLKQYE